MVQKTRTELSDDSLVSAEDRTCTAWFDFVREMEGQQYGAQETLDAWLWFKAGWSRGSEYHSLLHSSESCASIPAAAIKQAPEDRFMDGIQAARAALLGGLQPRLTTEGAIALRDFTRDLLAVVTDQVAEGLKEAASKAPLPAKVELRKLCLSHNATTGRVCGEPLAQWADRSWRCSNLHYNDQYSLVRETLGRLVREVRIVWTRDPQSPKSHRFLPWEKISEADREADRRIGEMLVGVRDWLTGQRI